MAVRIVLLLALFISPFAVAAEAVGAEGTRLDLTHEWVGYTALVIFFLAYLLVILEERIHLRKSKPVMAAAGLIWLLIAAVYSSHDISRLTEQGIQENFEEYAELFFFLLVAMTYINAMIERGVFEELRNWLVEKGFGYRALFWMTGTLAFFISPMADNLTTALIMCAVILAVGKNQPAFVALSCINIVVGANAGGAFSPFGDITTLMVWQREVLHFGTFFNLFIPAVVNFVVPALCMQFALPQGKPAPREHHHSALKQGGIPIVFLFLCTIVTAVTFHNTLGIPPVFGMMLGMAYLKFYGFYLRRCEHIPMDEGDESPPGTSEKRGFDIFAKVAQAEWDTLFFFYGVMLAVGGLGFIGYLSLASAHIYGEMGPTTANVLVGIMSAVVDNIPVMFAVLTMNPDMDQVQWLLVTFTAGVGGSLLSIGSAAGVALMGQARGQYTFFRHLKWTPAVGLGYAASIYVHFLING